MAQEQNNEQENDAKQKSPKKTKKMTTEQMYFHMLSHEIDDNHKKILNKAIFADQEAFLSSLDLSNHPHLVTKTDVAANDKNFLQQFTELLRDTQNLKIDESVIDNLIKSL